MVKGIMCGVPKEKLVELYIDNKMCLYDIAEFFNSSYSSVLRAFKRYEIPRNLRQIKSKIMQVPTEELRLLYIDNGLSIRKIAKQYKIHHEWLRQELKRRGIALRKERGCKSINMPSKEDLAYLVGVLAGDGSISDGYTYRLSAVDIDFVDNVANMLGKISKICRYVESRREANWNTLYVVVLCRKLFVDFVRDISFSDLSRRGKVRFINGFVDSEGYVSDGRRTYPRIIISNLDRELLSEILDFLNTDFGIGCRLFPKSDNGQCSCISIGTMDGLKKFRKIHSFIIGRKQKRFDSFFK